MKLSMRNGLILLVIGAYLIFNQGFSLVRIPPVVGGGVPVGEILLVFSLCLWYRDLPHLSLFTHSIIFIPFLIWWTFGIGKMVWALPEYGMWAMRDASHVIESLFLWVGFVFAATPGAIDRLFVWLRVILAIGCLYAFSYPWREPLSIFSPTITAAAGYSTGLFFVNYLTSGVLLLWEAVRRLIRRAGGSILVPGLLMAYAVGIFQARTLYLQLTAILLMILWYQGKAFKKMSLALVVGVLVFVLLAEFGVEIKGRIGETVSLEFIGRHFESISGTESAGVEFAAAGVGLRLGWWANLFERLTDSTENLLFGLGYGPPLIDFQGRHGQISRELHNSYVSTLGRMGLLGFFLFAWGHVCLVRIWFRAYNLCRQAGYRLGQDRLFLLMVYFVLVWVFSLGEDALEKPFITIPYYFFWGVVLHYQLHLKRALTQAVISPPKDSI
jgi:O-Antigen ligase